MSDGTQGTLGDFGQDAGTDDRPVADEAAAIAGNGGSDGGTSVVDLDERQFPPVEETVEFVVTQVDYTIEGQGDDEFPVVHVFGRTDDNEPVHARVFDFKPYFYAPTDSVTDDGLRQYDSITGWEEADADGEPYESIRGERLTKIFGQTPRDVGQIRDDFDHYEADILFPNRLLIDKDITSGVRVPARKLDDGSLKVHHEEIQPVEAHADPRVNTFDIEVDDRQGFPEDGEEPIICLTSHDSYRDEYVVWLYESPDGIDGPEALAGYDPIREDFEADVRVFGEEEAMLEAFVDYIIDTDPDVLTGWNFDDFDAPYFLDRLEELQSYNHDYDLSVDRLSRVDEVWRSGWGGPDIKGRVVFDLLYAYKRTQFTELESYRLDAVGEQELGVGKERYTGDIGDLWEQDPEQLLEYNLRDVELCVELDREQDIVDFWDEVRTFVGCKLEDATTPGDAVDMYVLHKLHGEFALPSKGQQESEDYEGGAVFDPITGVRENVTVLDLKSLYPMCMVTTNASPETKVDPETYDGDTYCAPNGTHFRKEPDGVIREMVDELLTEREEKKERRNSFDPENPEYERLDRQQAAVKVIMNSLYGVLGWDRFRLYDKEMGAAVTATGREVIDYTDEVVASEGYEVVYGDTDSVMLQLGDIGPADVEGDVTVTDEMREKHPEMSDDELELIAATIGKGFELEETINDSYDEFAMEELNADEHRFQIEFEKLYRRFFQAGKKKRYAGNIVWKEGKHVDDIDITGFEYQRSDIAPITKRVQKEVIDRIVRGEDAESIKQYVSDVIEDYQDGNVNYDDVGIPGGIGKKLDNYDTDTAQVRGAKYANLLLGTNFQSGSKPKRLYLDRVHSDFFQRIEEEEGLDPQRDPLYGEFRRDPDVICFEYADQIPEEFEIDWDKMLDKTLKGPIARILEAMDISWEEVKSGQEQTGLGSFM
ncbi:DNA polymerase elongation subunit [Haloarcula taiwanensis]|uniref:DNA polymerase n=1 Tax=Haloarcula taiwanensis TaxID=1932004 RepID=A0A2H5A055_9EURY|nr:MULTISPECIES: DNA-directed DNA polymerase [Haloarcula]AUG48111.1 DNA polymerase elongation subunit [Haloarcula taiwanensis]RLM39467.1 DNA polymerase elongation subunit [Haloarcula sp. Atlit-120R]RLM47364.1 DNA polymerase elongation subunit [Haloarcula sp. Atlit-47R]